VSHFIITGQDPNRRRSARPCVSGDRISETNAVQHAGMVITKRGDVNDAGFTDERAAGGQVDFELGSKYQ
jgi:hypothetical protein